MPEIRLSQQLFSDVRDIKAETLKDVYAIIHLAGVSNDPIGDKFEKVTDDINCQSSIRLAQLAKEAGVKRLLASLSTCAFPDVVKEYPFKEGNIFDGPPASFSERCLTLFFLGGLGGCPDCS